MGRPKNLDIRRQVKKLKDSGLNVRQIAMSLGLSTQRVYVLLATSEELEAEQAERKSA